MDDAMDQTTEIKYDLIDDNLKISEWWIQKHKVFMLQI